MPRYSLPQAAPKAALATGALLMTVLPLFSAAHAQGSPPYESNQSPYGQPPYGNGTARYGQSPNDQQPSGYDYRNPPPEPTAPDGYDGTNPPPPPPGYAPPPDDPAMREADARYAGEAERWARDNCVKSHGNAGTGAVIGGLFGAIIGSAMGGRHDHGGSTFAGAAVGALGGAAIASSSSGGTSPGCPPGYVVRREAVSYEYAAPDYAYAAPGWYRPWVYTDGRWGYRPYPYHSYYYRTYRAAPPYYRGAPPYYRGGWQGGRGWEHGGWERGQGGGWEHGRR